jgi:hypothetical protein
MLRKEYLSCQICASTNDFVTHKNYDFGGGGGGGGLQCVVKDCSELQRNVLPSS